MSELDTLRKKKASLEKELQEVENQIDKAEIDEQLKISKGRYERIVAALKSGKPFIIRLNPGCGSYHNLLIIKNLEVRTDSPVFEYECTVSGTHLEFYENMVYKWRSEPVDSYNFNSHRFKEIDVYDANELRRIFNEHKHNLECQVAGAEVVLKYVEGIK